MAMKPTLGVPVVVLLALASSQLAIAWTNRLCSNPVLARVLPACKQSQRPQLCPYSSWASWLPQRYVNPGTSGVRCTGGVRPIEVQRKRTLRYHRAGCNALTQKKVTCPPSTQQLISSFQQAFGGNFGVGRTPPNPGITYRQPAPSGGGGGWGRRRRRRRRFIYKPPTCSQPVEATRNIAIVLDSSGSVGRHVFNKAVDNLAKLLSMLCYNFERANCASDVRLALIVYGTHVREVFNFKRSAAEHTSKQKIKAAILRAKNFYDNGWTATGPALRYAYNNVFIRNAGMSPNAKKRLLLITDGRSNRGESPVGVARDLYYNKGVSVFPVGVGPNINFQELNGVRQVPQSSISLIGNFLLVDFSKFGEIVGEIEKILAPQPPGSCQRNVFRK